MAETTLKRHPGRAAAWGILLGLGVFVYLTFVWPIIALDSWTTVAVKAAIVIVAVMVLSVLWGMFGPAKKPKGAAPAYQAPPPAPETAPPPAPEPEAPQPPPPPEVETAPAAPVACPNCGTEIREGAKVCHSCGFRLDETPTGRGAGEPPTPESDEPIPD